eukprot:TRINITY_DN6061_c0_g1_i2.p1 TRINITY_DN6061_c0_g1~~TRINITY_DN6061_c0_g1_i2.p1  ORF type:complete len:797 (+),score=136.64 TRINITY_DN6061_c0_g1_i2:62-2452(+)
MHAKGPSASPRIEDLVVVNRRPHAQGSTAEELSSPNASANPRHVTAAVAPKQKRSTSASLHPSPNHVARSTNGIGARIAAPPSVLGNGLNVGFGLGVGEAADDRKAIHTHERRSITPPQPRSYAKPSPRVYDPDTHAKYWEKSGLPSQTSILSQEDGKHQKIASGLTPRPPAQSILEAAVLGPNPNQQDNAAATKHPLPPIDINKIAAMLAQQANAPSKSMETQPSGREYTSRKIKTERAIQNTSIRADGAWAHDASKQTFKHLLQETTCLCKDGEKVAYMAERRKKTEEDSHIPSPDVSSLDLESLIPDEYYIIKHHTVCPIHDENYPNRIVLKDGVWQEILFPALRPTNRDQVKYLEKTMDKMTQRIVEEMHIFDQTINEQRQRAKEQPDSQYEYDSSPLIEGFVSLIEKEQRIYNTIFHELVRQVTVECYDRGLLLAKTRQLYADLLSRVPKQAMFMYDELLAQRANTRKLQKELQRCREECSKIRELNLQLRRTSEDMSVTCEKQEETVHILEDNLRRQQDTFKDYLDLNQLQRARLEQELLRLREEKRSWFYHMEQSKGNTRKLVRLPALKDIESRLYRSATELGDVVSDMNKQHLRYFSTSHETFRSLLVKYSHEFVENLKSMCFKIEHLQKEANQILANIKAGEQIPSSSARYSATRWKEIVQELSQQLQKHEHDARRGLMNLKDLTEHWHTSANEMNGRIVADLKRSSVTELIIDAKRLADDWLQHSIFHMGGRFKDEFSLLLANITGWIERLSAGKEKSWPEFLYPTEAVSLQVRVTILTIIAIINR